MAFTDFDDKILPRQPFQRYCDMHSKCLLNPKRDKPSFAMRHDTGFAMTMCSHPVGRDCLWSFPEYFIALRTHALFQRESNRRSRVIDVPTLDHILSTSVSRIAHQSSHLAFVRPRLPRVRMKNHVSQPPRPVIVGVSKHGILSKIAGSSGFEIKEQEGRPFVGRHVRGGVS